MAGQDGSRPNPRLKSVRLGAAAMMLSIMAALCAAPVAPPVAAAPGEDDTPTTNPDLDPSCGLDIHVILDESGSIENARATEDVRRAFRAFTSALNNTGSRMAVSEFSTVARLPLSGGAQRGYTTVTNATIAGTFNPYIANYNPAGSTHWEDAFRVGRYFLPRPSADKPHLVVSSPTATPTWSSARTESPTTPAVPAKRRTSTS